MMSYAQFQPYCLTQQDGVPLQGPSSCGRIADPSQNPSLCTTYTSSPPLGWSSCTSLCRPQLPYWGSDHSGIGWYRRLHYPDAGTMAQFILSPVHQTQPSTPGKSHCHYGQVCNLTVIHSMVLTFICISLQHTLWHSHVYYILSDHHIYSMSSISSPCFIATPSLNTRRLLVWVLPGSLSCGG